MDEKAIIAICLIGIIALCAIAVVAINPPQNLNNLSNVLLVGLSDGQVLTYNSTTGNWANQYVNGTAVPLEGLTDVLINSIQNNQVIQYNSTSLKWENRDLSFDNYSIVLSRNNITDFWDAPFWSSIIDKPSTFTPSSHSHDAGDVISGILDVARIPNLSLSHVNISDWNTAMDWSYIQNKPSTFTPSAHNHAASDINSGTFGNDRLDLSALAQNIAFTSTQTVDGVDISALLLKAIKVTDLGTIWDKTTKIAFGDTDFVNQSLLTTSSPTFAGLTLNGALNFGADVNLYRYSQDYLKTDDVFIAAELFVGVDYNVYISPNQEIYFGNKVDTWDVRLYRSAADTLKTDDAFIAVGDITGANIITAGNVDGVDISANINQAVKTTSSPTFGALHVNSVSYGALYISAFATSDEGSNSLPFWLARSAAQFSGIGFRGVALYDMALFTEPNDDTIYVGKWVGSGPFSKILGINASGLTIMDGYALQWSDVNLYRSAANVLKTDDAFQAADYKSSDGSTGYTGVLGGITFKNGLAMAP